MNKRKTGLTHNSEDRGELHIQAVSQSFSGPLPPPQALAAYEAIVVGAADRIIAMAESQNQHRQTLERSVVQSNIDAQSRGTYLGFILCMTAILGGVWLTYIGRPVSGLVSIITTLVALAGVFVFGKRKQRKELDERSKALAKQ